jgi:hypothetical protein
MKTFRPPSLSLRCVVGALTSLLFCLSVHGQTELSDTTQVIDEDAYLTPGWQFTATPLPPTLPANATLIDVYAIVTGLAMVSEDFSTSGPHFIDSTFTIELLQDGSDLGSTTFSASQNGNNAGTITGYGNPDPLELDIPLPTSLSQDPLTFENSFFNGSGDNPKVGGAVAVVYDYSIIPEPSAVGILAIFLPCLGIYILLSKKRRNAPFGILQSNAD